MLCILMWLILIFRFSNATKNIHIPNPHGGRGWAGAAPAMRWGRRECYCSIAERIVAAMWLRSSSVTHGPAGRQRPVRKRASLTPLVYAGAAA